MGLIAVATAAALEAARRRQEEEARVRAEMDAAERRGRGAGGRGAAPGVVGGPAAASAIRRLMFFLAGPMAIFLLAYAVLTVGFATGWPDVVRVVTVAPGSPAEAAGLLPGDQVVALQGSRVTAAEDLSRALRARAGEVVALDVRRGDRQISLQLTLSQEPPPGKGPAGFDSTGEIVRYPPFKAACRAAQTIASMVTGTLHALARVMAGTGEEAVRVVSPVGLVQISDQAISNAVSWRQPYPGLYLASWLSVAVALFNLLPWPALDGGHAALALVQAVAGRRPSDRAERRLHAVGMFLLLSLMLGLVVADLLRAFR